MSSNVFGVTLQTDPLGRRIVRVSGILLLLAGVILILQLPFDRPWRLLLLVIWAGDCGFSLWRLERGYRRILGIRMDADGGFMLVGPGNAVTPGALVSGSLVYRRVAWLRFTLPGAGRHAELLLGARAESLDWHRFQLIWRLNRDIFGHPARA